MVHTIKKYIEGVFHMTEFSLWKNLKKRLRRKRRPLWMLGGIMFCLLAGWCAVSYSETVYAETPKPKNNNQSIIKSLQQKEGPLTVKLHQLYVCGEEMRPLGRMMTEQIVQLLLVHPEWTATMDKDQSTILFEERIDDLSEHCKAHAYMGVDKKGNLTLYDGVPKKEKVVRTFFQLDVRYMESSLPQDKLDKLSRGIRISDIDEYNSVLSTYSDYAMEQNEKVMKPTY